VLYCNVLFSWLIGWACPSTCVELETCVLFCVCVCVCVHVCNKGISANCLIFAQGNKYVNSFLALNGACVPAKHTVHTMQPPFLVDHACGPVSHTIYHSISWHFIAPLYASLHSHVICGQNPYMYSYRYVTKVMNLPMNMYS